jgi:amino acid adenylation domain-containing protein
VLQAGLAVLLSRHGGGDDVAIGSPVAGRTEPELEDLVGVFLNTLVFRTDLAGNPSFRELLDRVRAFALNAYEHQDAPFERVVGALCPVRSLARHPLFQVMLVLQNMRTVEMALQGLVIRPEPVASAASKFDLTLNLAERVSESGEPQGLDGVFEYALELFEAPTIEALGRRFLTLLRSAMASPDVAVRRLAMLEEGEWAGLLPAQRSEPEASPATVVELFEAQVAGAPGAAAVTFEERTLSYGELNERANRLAHSLIGRGVGPGSLVGLCFERSVELVVGVLGVLKAGAAYLPLDPDYPQARLAHMLEDAGPALILCTATLRERLPSTAAAAVALDTAEQQAVLAACGGHDPGAAERPMPLRAQHAAYVIYTSGSTGLPKGVVVTHANVVRLFTATQAWFGFDAGDVWTLFHSYAFDFSVWEIWGALLHGGRLVVVPKWLTRSPEDFLALLVRQQVTVLSQTPSAFYQLMQADAEQPRLGDRLCLRSVVFGGEALELSRLSGWYRRHGDDAPRLVNMYGITETTVHVSYLALDRALAAASSSLIGVGIPDLRVYLLDDALEPVPPGVAGELYIAGAGLAQGYLNRTGLTAERFVADPYAEQPGRRMYRSGDLARWTSQRTLEFIGRADQQVKIRGFRIEPGEIEAALRSHERVRDACVIAHVSGEHQQLLAYVIGRELNVAEARASQLSHWQEVYESTYGCEQPAVGDFDIVGWISSYTGQPIPAAEMRLWMDHTVARLRAFRPHAVLEIGCGTGLLLTRIAPECDGYLGLDFSAAVLAKLAGYVAKRPDLVHVQLRQQAAHDLSAIDDDSVDLVILNSVVQYFPDLDYLLRVVAEAIRVTRDGGHVFIGDVRSLPLLEAYHTSVQLHRARDDTSTRALRESVDQAMRRENELVLDPALFAGSRLRSRPAHTTMS